MQKVSKNIKETIQIAKEFLTKIKPDKKRATIVALYGNLGAGKTAFTQAVACELGVKRKVNSPTYVIVKKYTLKKPTVQKNFLANKTKPVSAGENFSEQLAFKTLFHIDAYRLKNEKELKYLGWQDIVGNPEHLVFIEWPERIQKALPKKHHKIEISHLPAGRAGAKEGHRKFKIKKY